MQYEQEYICWSRRGSYNSGHSLRNHFSSSCLRLNLHPNIYRYIKLIWFFSPISCSRSCSSPYISSAPSPSSYSLSFFLVIVLHPLALFFLLCICTAHALAFLPVCGTTDKLDQFVDHGNATLLLFFSILLINGKGNFRKFWLTTF